MGSTVLSSCFGNSLSAYIRAYVVPQSILFIESRWNLHLKGLTSSAAEEGHWALLCSLRKALVKPRTELVNS